MTQHPIDSIDTASDSAGSLPGADWAVQTITTAVTDIVAVTTDIVAVTWPWSTLALAVGGCTATYMIHRSNTRLSVEADAQHELLANGTRLPHELEPNRTAS